MPYTDQAKQAEAVAVASIKRRRNMTALLAHARQRGWSNLAELTEALNTGAVKLPCNPKKKDDEVKK